MAVQSFDKYHSCCFLLFTYFQGIFLSLGFSAINFLTSKTAKTTTTEASMLQQPPCLILSQVLWNNWAAIGLFFLPGYANPIQK